MGKGGCLRISSRCNTQVSKQILQLMELILLKTPSSPSLLGLTSISNAVGDKLINFRQRLIRNKRDAHHVWQLHRFSGLTCVYMLKCGRARSSDSSHACQVRPVFTQLHLQR